MNDDYCVYSLFNLDTGELLYIGRSNDPSRRKRAFEIRSGLRTRMRCKWFDTFEDACNAERDRILRCAPPWNLKVISSRGNAGRNLSDEHKGRISEARKGAEFTAEHRKNLSEAMKSKTNRKGWKGPNGHQGMKYKKSLQQLAKEARRAQHHG